jgi:glycosyltransferase involved in cell wall biosynthesis
VSQESLRVCIVTDAYLPGIGGVENHILHLSAELLRLGHQPVVVTHRVPPNAPQLPEQVESPVPVVRLPGALLVVREHDVAVDPRMVGAFKRHLDENRCDIVHGQSEGSYLVYEALAAARSRGLPTVLTRHSVVRTKPAVPRFFLLPLTRMLTRRASGVICVSRACAEESAGFPGPVRVIPNGVNTDEFRPMPEERARKRADLGYGDGDVVVGFVGRLHSTKGVPLLLEAFGRLRGGNPRVKLLLAGPGPLRGEIEAAARDSGGAIRLLEPLPYDGVPGLLSALDVFAFPSRGEAFGISLLEAMACGVASVALGRWGVRELVEDGVTGLLAEGPADFSRKLGLLVSDAETRSRMGAAARRAVELRFSWPAIAAETVSFYRELIAGRRAS